MIFRKRIPKHCLIVEDSRFQPPYKNTKSKTRKLKWVFFAVMLVLISITAAKLAQAENDSAQIANLDSINDAEAGQVLFPLAGGRFQQAVHLKTTADIHISGMVARVSYRQFFKNDSDEWREAIYVFPLSENAAVNEMEMRIGDRLIRAQIKEKAQAKKIYENAKSEGKKAALTEQQRPNLFTQKVANIAPGEEIEIKLGYLQQVKYDQDSQGKGAFSFYLPTTLTPRYMPGLPMAGMQVPMADRQVPVTERQVPMAGMQVPMAELDPEKSFANDSSDWANSSGRARPTNQVPDAHKISPFMLPAPINGLRNPIEININLEAGLQLDEISSRSHNISQRKVKNQYQISLANQQVSMDRDFWLEWSPVPSDQPEAAVFKEQINNEDYALIMLLPPQVATSDTRNENKLPREVIFIIDTSGSMGGTSIHQAKDSLQLALERLNSKDRFNIIEFNSNTSNLFHTPMPATKSNRRIASTFVHRLGAGGGTNMAPALEIALDTPSAEGFLKQVLFITDGAVGNEDQLFKLIQSKLGNARLFTVGIGSAPNSHFMSRAARFGRGTFEYISNQSEIAERMSNLFRTLESPVLSDLSISYSKNLDGLIEQFPQRTPDLYAGEPLVLSIKAQDKTALKGKLHISGTVGDGTGETANWTRSLSLNDNNQHQGIAAIWARKKIAALMDEKILGRDKSEVKDEVLKVAIPHKLISAYTSFVAVEERISREPSADRKPPAPLKPGIVPNAVANGQLPQAQSQMANQHSYPNSYPKTATWLPLNLLMGNLSVLLLLALYRRNITRRISQIFGVHKKRPKCSKH